MSTFRFRAVSLFVWFGVFNLCITPVVLFAEENAHSASTIHDASLVEKAVRDAFTDAPVMAEIARCESKFRQYTDSGNPFRGGAGGTMIGVFQFNEPIHSAYATTLGFDLTTLEGNIGYAKYVYAQSGTDPWISSFGCWGTTNTETGENTDPNVLHRDLSFGQVDPQVLLLQKILNEKGFTVAEYGPGSPGNETTMFGNLTRAAVRKFQCAQDIACSGDEYTTGYGYVDAKTRTALRAFAPDSHTETEHVATEKPEAQKPDNTSADPNQEALIAELMKLVLALQAQLAALLASQAGA